MIEKVIFWIGVAITLYFIGFYKTLRDRKVFSKALILSPLLVIMGIWGVISNKYLIEGKSAYFFLFWLPSFVILFQILRNYLLKRDGVEPIIGWMSAYDSEKPDRLTGHWQANKDNEARCLYYISTGLGGSAACSGISTTTKGEKFSIYTLDDFTEKAWLRINDNLDVSKSPTEIKSFRNETEGN